MKPRPHAQALFRFHGRSLCGAASLYQSNRRRRVRLRRIQVLPDNRYPGQKYRIYRLVLNTALLLLRYRLKYNRKKQELSKARQDQLCHRFLRLFFVPYTLPEAKNTAPPRVLSQRRQACHEQAHGALSVFQTPIRLRLYPYYGI